MNTKIEYLYRDASNYKMQNRVIVRGLLTTEQVEQIINACNELLYFIPSQVGLPETRFPGAWTEDDHCWFELCRGDFSATEEEETVDITAEELYRNFINVKRWNDTCCFV